MVSVGIDIAKDKSTVCILRPYGEILKSPFDILHDDAEVNTLIVELMKIGDEVRIVMEATGTYHLPLLQQLKAAGLFVSVINPLAMKRHACLITEIGDIRRFNNNKSLVAYAGIDAPPFQSGTFNGTRRNISKRGSPVLRKAGFEAMQCLKRNKPTEDNAEYLYILKKEAEGKPKKGAKIAGLNKFLRIYYARVSALYA